MKKLRMTLLVVVCGCLCGCTSTLTVGQTTWTVDSIPAGIWGLDITVSGFTSVTSLDAVKGIGLAVDGLKSLVVGMVPLG